MPGYLKSVNELQGLPYILSSNNKYVVRIAKSEDELEKIQALRFKVFNLELGEGLESSYMHQRDVDPYDDQFQHLLVIERDSGAIIGTYRMQTYAMASAGIGFYSETEFRIYQLPKNKLKKSVEVGRACIAKKHRNGRVLYLLWKGLAKFLMFTQSRYLFGCCSITSQDEIKAWQVMEYLKRKRFIHHKLRIDVKHAFECGPVDVNPNSSSGIKLPQLFQLYMDIGAKVCSQPAIDREFKTIDYLVILDIESLDDRMKMLFFK